MQKVGNGVWREKMKNVENYMQTLQDLEYDKKYWKMQKMRNAHYRTCNMAKKTEKRDTNTL